MNLGVIRVLFMTGHANEAIFVRRTGNALRPYDTGMSFKIAHILVASRKAQLLFIQSISWK